MLSQIECDVARLGGGHDEATCGTRSPYVRVKAGTLDDPDGRRPHVVMHVDEVVLHIGDRLHDWRGLSFLDRLEWYELCPAGICTSPYLTGAHAAWDVIALEGLSEQMGGLPKAGGWLDQPEAYVQAFSVIRSTRNAVQMRNLKAASQKPR